jgi:hypothetical protein
LLVGSSGAAGTCAGSFRIDDIASIDPVDAAEQRTADIASRSARAASVCEIVGASEAIRIASNPSQLPIFRWKRLKIRSSI